MQLSCASCPWPLGVTLLTINNQRLYRHGFFQISAAIVWFNTHLWPISYVVLLRRNLKLIVSTVFFKVGNFFLNCSRPVAIGHLYGRLLIHLVGNRRLRRQ